MLSRIVLLISTLYLTYCREVGVKEGTSTKETLSITWNTIFGRIAFPILAVVLLVQMLALYKVYVHDTDETGENEILLRHDHKNGYANQVLKVKQDSKMNLDENRTLTEEEKRRICLIMSKR